MGQYRNTALYGSGAAAVNLGGGDVSYGESSANGCPIGVLATAAGNVKLDLYDGSTVTLPIAAGAVLSVMVRKIYQSGTTATGLFVIF